MNAQEARRISLSVTIEGVQAQTLEVYGKIKAACDKGELTCYFLGSLLHGTIQKLTADGYKLEVKEDNERGIATTYYQISW